MWVSEEGKFVKNKADLRCFWQLKNITPNNKKVNLFELNNCFN